METESLLTYSKYIAILLYLSQLNPVHTLSNYLSNTYFSFIFISTSCSSTWSLPLRCYWQLFWMQYSLFPCVTCQVDLILHLLITLYKLWSFFVMWSRITHSTNNISLYKNIINHLGIYSSFSLFAFVSSNQVKCDKIFLCVYSLWRVRMS